MGSSVAITNRTNTRSLLAESIIRVLRTRQHISSQLWRSRISLNISQLPTMTFISKKRILRVGKTGYKSSTMRGIRGTCLWEKRAISRDLRTRQCWFLRRQKVIFSAWTWCKETSKTEDNISRYDASHVMCRHCLQKRILFPSELGAIVLGPLADYVGGVPIILSRAYWEPLSITYILTTGMTRFKKVGECPCGTRFFSLTF